MGLRRIAYAAAESVVLTADGDTLLAFDVADGQSKWELRLEKRIAAVVFTSPQTLPRERGDGPWRSPASGSSAVAVDMDGGVHHVDVAAGNVLDTLEPVGEPVAVAAGADVIAIAVANAKRVVLWRAGERHELAYRATALALSRDGTTLALATPEGELHFIAVATRAIASTVLVSRSIAITDVVQHPGGAWAVATDRGLFTVKDGRVASELDGAVANVAIGVDGKRVAVHRTDTTVVVYDWPPLHAQTRIKIQRRFIVDVAIGPKGRLGVALDGGDAGLVNLATQRVRRLKPAVGRTAREWNLEVDDEAKRQERVAAKAREDAARLATPPSSPGLSRGALGGGAVVFFVAIRLVLLLVRAGGSSSSYSGSSWESPRPITAAPQTCDHACGKEKLAKIVDACAKNPALACADDSSAALAAFEAYDCSGARSALERIANVKGDALVAAQALLARIELKETCNESDKPVTPTVQRFDDRDLATPFDEGKLGPGERVEDLWAAPDGSVFVLAKTATRCAVWRKSASKPFEVSLEAPKCFASNLFGRTANDVYASFDASLHHFDGKKWELLNERESAFESIGGPAAPSNDLFAYAAGEALLHRADAWKVDGAAKADDARPYRFGPAARKAWALGIRQADAGALFDVALVRSGDTWSKRMLPPDVEDPSSIWASPGGDVWVTTPTELLRSTDEGKTWQRDDKHEVRRLWGRSNSEVYATTLDGVIRFDGKTWSKTSYERFTSHLAGNAKSVYIVR